jgi:hypothetical protein
MQYRCETTSLVGFVQQLAANVLCHGYWFYVTGRVPDGKDPRSVDRKLIAKYGVEISRQQRARRKQVGLANIHYLRCGRFWVLLATHGNHLFFAEEGERVRDARVVPILVEGYSLSVKRGQFLKKVSATSPAMPDGKYRVRVQIARERYRDLRAYFVGRACHLSTENLARELWSVQFEPYAPVRKQLLNVLRLVNAKRQQAGFSKIPPSVLRYRRQIVKAFEPTILDAAA